MPKYKPFGFTEDNRPIYKIRLGRTEYEIREPTASERLIVEADVAAEHLPFAKETGKLPEGYLKVDSKFVPYLATIISPKLDAKLLRNWPAKRWAQLVNMIEEVLDLSTPDEALFPALADDAGDMVDNEGDGMVVAKGSEPDPARDELHTGGIQLAAVAAQRSADIRPITRAPSSGVG